MNTMRSPTWPPAPLRESATRARAHGQAPAAAALGVGVETARFRRGPAPCFVVANAESECYGARLMSDRASGGAVSATQLASEPARKAPAPNDAEKTTRLGPLPEGEVLGHYRIVEHLDSGGMGHIHRAVDMRLERSVAIKVAVGRVEGEAARTLQEARALAALNHVNVVTVYELGVHDGRPYIVMELLRGETLRARIHRSPPSLAETLRWSCDVLRGMTAAHNAGIVHLDLKPENLFLTADGTLKILDFGVARLVGADQGSERVVAGTVAYMAPEQIAPGPVDFRADLFAFGVILHELTTGRHPFKKATVDETAAALADGRHEPNAEIPDAEVEAVVRACLAHDPAARPGSAVELFERLERVRRARSFDGERAVVSLAETDDGHVAVQSVGTASGVDLVIVPGLLSRFDAWTQEPEGASYLRALSAERRVVVFDRCGLGASDRLSDASIPSIDDEVGHLIAVLDAAGTKRAVLFAMDEGAPLALLAAALLPERIAGVIVAGGCASYSDPETARRLADRARLWGASSDAPSSSGAREPRLARWVATWERMTSTPRTARARIAALQRTDVRAVLPFVAPPVLVLASAEVSKSFEALPSATIEPLANEAGAFPWSGSDADAARVSAFVRSAERASFDNGLAMGAWCVTDLLPRELPVALRSTVVATAESLSVLDVARPALAVRSLRAVLGRRGAAGGRAAMIVATRAAGPARALEEGRILLTEALPGAITAAPLARTVLEGTAAIRLGPIQRADEAPTESSRETLEEVAPLAHRTFSVSVEAGPELRIEGQMMLREPERLLMPHFRRIHERVSGGRLVLDVRKLSQVNSSNLGVFIQWIGWIRAEPEERRYELVVLADPKIAWQRTNLLPLEMIAPEILRVNMDAS
jgi:pimeloyl-ACP methyl ester carboxylesterase